MQYEINDQEVRSRLTDEQYFVTQHAGTERAFTGCYWDTKEEGKYHCIVCDAELFVSDTKFDSGTGWPSFFEPISESVIATKEDNSLGMSRIEILCSNCDAHLGHVFPDGPGENGLRYCINSVCLNFYKKDLK